MSPNKIAPLIVASIGIIVLALAVRISQVRESMMPGGYSLETARGQQQLQPDSSFYQNSQPGQSPAPARSASTAPAAPAQPSNGISAKAYLAGNVVTGQIYLERDQGDVLPVASMSKLVTALVATDEISATATIEITPAEAAAPPDGSGIHAGERYTMKELLYPMLLDSSNIAAEAIASSSDRAKFLELMSSYAWEIGMPSTFFADPSGVSPYNEADATDLFALARYLYASRPDILAITRAAEIPTATTTDHDAHDFVSIHPFVKDPRFIGGKTGHTPEAEDTMMTIMHIGSQPVAFIVLSSDNQRQQDTQKLIDMVSGMVK